MTLLLCAVAFSFPALADKGGKGGKSSGVEVLKDIGREDRREGGVLISRSEREIIRGFLVEERTRSCPPGLAKKHNGCLPPGLAKKYHSGDRLDDSVNFRDLPERLLRLLSPPAKGHKYVMVDDEVLLIAEATQLVLDAVDILGKD